MSDLISRQDAIDMFQRLAYDDWNQGASTTWANAYSEAVDMVRELPSAQPKRYLIDSFTRKISVLPSTNNTGKWLGKYCPYTCNQCGKTSDSRTPFCRYCGADMRE